MSITLTRAAVSEETLGGRHVWPLKVTAVSDTSGLPSDIFVYHADAGGDLLNGDMFECVASVSQLDDLGTEPDFISDPVVPYYRGDFLEFNCRSARDLELLWSKIQEEVQSLHNNFTSWERIQDATTVEIT